MLWFVLMVYFFCIALYDVHKTKLFTIREHCLKVNNLPFDTELFYESASLNYTRKGINKKKQPILYPIRYIISVTLDLLTCPVSCSVTYPLSSLVTPPLV